MHRCLDEEALVRIAAGLLSPDEAEGVLAEVELCPYCRSSLIEAGHALQPAFSPTEPMFRVGEIIAGRYAVHRFIGRGGMGEVFEVLDNELHERVALKTIRSELSGDLQVVSRFKQELRLARKVIHPNVARVFDLGTFLLSAAGASYFHTMELIDGRPLSAWVNGRALDPSVVVHLARQMAAGLGAIHEHGIVHRDFKPDNVMVRNPGHPLPDVCILDFGIARSRDRLSGLATTARGVRLGTPDYMAPEALHGGEVSPASDVFSFGLVAYELLTGSHPCPHPGTRVARSALGELAIAPPTQLRAAIPQGISRLVLACLHSDAKQRPQGGGELSRLLGRLDDAGRDLSVAGALWNLARSRLGRV